MPSAVFQSRRPSLEAAVAEGEFDFLVPYSERRPLLTPQEVARALHRSVDFVETMILEGRLEAFAPEGRKKQRKTITRRSVLVLLAEQALSEPSEFFERFLRCADALTTAQLDQVLAHLNRRRTRL